MSSSSDTVGIPTPFVVDALSDVGKSSANYVHIRNQQRNGKKSLTTVQGLSSEFDLKRLLKAFKKNFSCNGTIIDDAEHGSILQIQGDHRQNVAKFLVSESIVSSDEVKIHGA
ncbi:putative translation initiation factor SUI1 [Cryptosporidium serpentis]|uniref:Translation initiation factor SUI1, putative n=2 Tax=Cryptosporidium TaxID=5806 RepID=B6AE23_CRYMR|nr:translation initiation factor SUI1, putative [Cryptosporidium muris RN66]EEA06464.1 translation initiation factor SUI1, putative [Cryptosporidium muris RN66]OII76054.1 translation initiation factor SUI1 [Cryptosporidium andersoni]|eukprot:XP_002140813.1 translation initiation factor SUI1 [Cryptosporidium muris RN66]